MAANSASGKTTFDPSSSQRWYTDGAAAGDGGGGFTSCGVDGMCMQDFGGADVNTGGGGGGGCESAAAQLVTPPPSPAARRGSSAS